MHMAMSKSQAARGFNISVGALALAFATYLVGSLLLGSPQFWLFVIAIAGWVVVLARGATGRAIAATACFWLAVQTLLLPGALVLAALLDVDMPATAAGQTGVTLGATIIAVLAFAIAMPIAAALWLLSRRLQPGA